MGAVTVAPMETLLGLQLEQFCLCSSTSRYCVQEVSADPPGSIPIHVRMLRPQIAIVTTIGGDHYKSFRSLEATAKEKGTLVEALPRNGTAILNADDPHVRAMASRTRAKVLTFGVSPDANIRATEISSVWPDRLKLTIIHDQNRVRVHTRLAGEHLDDVRSLRRYLRNRLWDRAQNMRTSGRDVRAGIRPLFHSHNTR